ncbi:hypothetical protein [Mycolicibacterium sp.]
MTQMQGCGRYGHTWSLDDLPSVDLFAASLERTPAAATLNSESQAVL